MWQFLIPSPKETKKHIPESNETVCAIMKRKQPENFAMATNHLCSDHKHVVHLGFIQFPLYPGFNESVSFPGNTGI